MVVERAPAPAMPPGRHSAALRPAFSGGMKAHEENMSTNATHSDTQMPEVCDFDSWEGRFLGSTADIKTVSSRAEAETVFWPTDSWGAV